MAGRKTYPIDSRRRRSIQEAITEWFRGAQRSLPWRDDPTPYHVWIAEIMAQQTRISAVTPYYERFVKRFPDVETLAGAPPDDVLALWSGLGYYSRARNLHEAAKRIVAEHGAVPVDPEVLLTLPGIGRYTAGAIASVAGNLPAPIVDGNVIRVLSRVEDIAGDVTRAETKQRFWELADALVDGSDASAFNQGMMELGALICTPRSPSCLICPLRRLCKAYRTGSVEKRPTKKAAARVVTVNLAGALIADGRGRVLLVRNPDAGLFGGLWQIPVVTAKPRAAADVLRDHLADLLRREVKVGKKTARVEHTLSHRHLVLDVYECALTGKAGRFPNGCRWTDDAARKKLGLSTFMKKALTASAAWA